MKKKEKPKDERESPAANSGWPDFYKLLDNLVGQSSRLLRDSLENYKERSESKPTKEKNETTFLPELEKEKTKCVLELLRIAIDQYQRVGADYANYQKRTAKQIDDTIAYEKEQIIKTVLPVLDNFEHTLQNAPSAGNVDSLIKGVKIIYDQMLDMLKIHGVEQIKTLDEKFDPALHQAIMQRSEPDKEENVVLEEFQKGYKLNGRVIRPSRVIVNKPPSKQGPAEPKAAEEKPEEEKSDIQKQTSQENEITNGE